MARRSEGEASAFEAGDHAPRDGKCDCKGTLRARCRVTRRDQDPEDAEAGVIPRLQTAILINGREVSAGMKTALYSLVASTFSILPLSADLTIVYSTTVQPASQGQQVQTTHKADA